MWEKNIEIKDMKDQLNELITLLRKSEAQKKELVRDQKAREQAVAIALGTSPSVSPPSQLFSGLNISCLILRFHNRSKAYLVYQH